MTEVRTLAAVTTEPQDRIFQLLDQMTLEEKLAQIVGFWEMEDGEAVAPLQGEFGAITGLEQFALHGLGHLTRAYGTRPVDAVERARWVWEFQRKMVSRTRLGIPAIVHEECLTGLSVWKAATFPTPLAWGAAFDPELVERMGAMIGGSMRALGIHQGPALGAGRGVHPRGPVPGRHRGHRVRARPAVAGGARHAEALRRLLLLPRR